MGDSKLDLLQRQAAASAVIVAARADELAASLLKDDYYDRVDSQEIRDAVKVMETYLTKLGSLNWHDVQRLKKDQPPRQISGR